MNATTKFTIVGDYVCAHSNFAVPTKLVYKGVEHETVAISGNGLTGIYRRP
jgi:hypothetical protein